MGLGLLSGCGGGSGNATPAPTGGGAASFPRWGMPVTQK